MVIRKLYRYVSIVIFILTLQPLPASAVQVCCSCQLPDDTVSTCVTADSVQLTSATDCSILPEKLNLPDEWTCTPEPITTNSCQPFTTGGSAVCQKGPVTAASIIKPKSEEVSTGVQDPNEQGIPFALNVPIPGFTPVMVSKNLFGEYVGSFFRFAISIVAIVSTIMFIYGAFVYLLGAAIPSIQQGKQIMMDAVIGLLLVLGSVTILRTINPSTVALEDLVVPGVSLVPWDEEPIASPARQGTTQLLRTPSGGSITYTVPKSVCSGEGCAQYCNGCNIKTPLPPADWIPDISEMVPVEYNDGLQRPLGEKYKNLVFYMIPDAAKALQEAGNIAATDPDGPFILRIGETYRPLANQMAAACRFACGSTQKKFAPPGASNHGSGIAVDLSLYRDRAALVYPTSPLSKQRNLKEEYARKLQQIMSAAGFVQYCPEIWHWEFGKPERGEYSRNCPWPPPSPR